MRMFAVSLLLLSLSFTLACSGGSQSTSEESASTGSSSESRGHEHEAPHGGTLLIIGDEFAHLELVLDESTGRLTAFLLDGEAKNAVRTDMTNIVIMTKVGDQGGPVILQAQANDLTGETVGDSSQFEAQADLLAGVDAFEGIIPSIKVKGQVFENISFQFPQGHH